MRANRMSLMNIMSSLSKQENPQGGQSPFQRRNSLSASLCSLKNSRLYSPGLKRLFNGGTTVSIPMAWAGWRFSLPS